MSDYDNVSTAVGDLVKRFTKAVGAAVGTGTAAASVSLQADGNYKTALVAGVLAALGGFGFVALLPANKAKVESHPIRPDDA